MKTRVEVMIVQSREAESDPQRRGVARQCSSRSTARAALVLTALVGASCGARLDDGLHSTDTGNPPVVDSGRITARLDGGTILIEGTRGAVSAGAEVFVHNEAIDASASTTAGEDGAFDVRVTGKAGHTVVVRIQTGRETSSIALEVTGAATASRADPTFEATDEPDADTQQTAQPDASTPLDPTAPRSLTPRDVEWTNVDWQRSTAIDLTETASGPGLWMGTDRGEALQIEPPYPVDEAPVARRFSGVAPATGGYSYYHIGAPMERSFHGVYFNARTRAAGTQLVRVTIGGAVEEYWSDVNNGTEWPVWEVELGERWSRHELTFSALGFDAEHLSPYSYPWGALHFLIPAEQAYDFEIFDLLFVSFLPN